jgi:hypothetical protein
VLGRAAPGGQGDEELHKAAHHLTESADATSTACAITFLLYGSLHLTQLLLEALLVLLVHHRRLLCLAVAQPAYRLLEGAHSLLACPRILWKRRLHVQLLERLDQRQ